MKRSNLWVVPFVVLGSSLVHSSSGFAEESAWKTQTTTPAPAPEAKTKKKKTKKKESTTVIEVSSPKDLREKTVRGNEPLTPDEQSTTVDSSNVFSRTWKGFRSYLAERGVQIDPVYKGDLVVPISGGKTQKTEHLGNFDLKASLNAEKLVGWKGGTVFIYGLFNYGGHPGRDTTANNQGIDNIESPRKVAKIYELWAQQTMADDKVSLLAGLHDLNSEFYVTEASSLFINPSFGIGRELSQTGRNGPSIFPVTSLALRARFEPTPEFVLQAAAFDAIAGAGDPLDPRGTKASLGSEDGILSMTEFSFLPGSGVEGAARGKYTAGFWNYSKTFNHLTAVDGNGTPKQDVSHGFYLLGEQTFAEKFTAFVRFGKASSSVNTVSSNLSGGLVVTGPFKKRSEDRLGVAITQVRAGREYRDSQAAAGNFAEAAESILEMTYRFEFGRGVAWVLDYQFVKNPNFDPTIQDAKVGITRLEIAF